MIFVCPDRPISLGLSCAMGVVEMTWNTSLDTFYRIDNISLHTACATMELSEEVHVSGNSMPNVELPSSPLHSQATVLHAKRAKTTF